MSLLGDVNSRRHTAIRIGLLSVVLSCLTLASGGLAASSRPNILFIVGDDMGYADVGFHGCKDIPTPNLDALTPPGCASPTAMSPVRTVRRRGPD